MQGRTIRSVAVATALVAASAGGYLYRGRAMASSAAAPPSPAPAAAAPAPAAMALPDFSAIVQRYGPAVVNVSTTGTVPAGFSSPFGQLDPNDPFFQFFRHFGVPEQRGQMLTRGLGSGFVVKPDGTILTNAHVVAGASEVKVKLTDKREFTAKVVGLDKTTDVAVLKIDARDLPTVKIGDPAQTRVGEWVLAIGSPFGFENSATAGVVSARSRSLPDEGYVPFIQTDVAINPGNSGGPLFDTAGDVIGINSQIYSQSGGYMGLSFAIPIDVAMKVEQQLIAHGKVTRGRLGVTIQDVNQALADSFGLPKPSGALVSSVEKGSPAAAAGIQPGDVILALDGKDLPGSTDLPPRVADLKPGTKARLDVWRDHRRREIEVRVGEAKDATLAGAGPKDAEHGRLGLVVRPLTPQERQQAGVGNGVVVEEAEGPAARAGIQAGDVVLAVNGTRVTSVDQLRGLAAKAGKHAALLVERGEARIFIPVDLG
ncbi:MAG TPA: DegQ family serine endoprotease [Anaeromyxobacteraceae bacterium]|nr:DegQ family serine endoprotease [Anaeromyxobacteraceae bacterium]